MLETYKEILDADIIVFVSPVYFYTWTFLIKSTLDRLFALESIITDKKICLISAYIGNLFICLRRGSFYVKKRVKEKEFKNQFCSGFSFGFYNPITSEIYLFAYGVVLFDCKKYPKTWGVSIPPRPPQTSRGHPCTPDIWQFVGNLIFIYNCLWLTLAEIKLW